MSEEVSAFTLKTVENAEISATANAEAKIKLSIWADKVDIETITVLEGMMENFESWNSNFRNELNKRDCIDVIKYAYDEEDKLSIISNKNVAMFLRKSVNQNLLRMVEGQTAFETYKDIVDMAPDKSSIVRAIIAEVALVSTIDMEAYVLEHQGIHSRLIKADPKRTIEASTHPAHMNRLLDGLSTEQQLTMNYLLSTRDDRSKASAKDAFKVGLKPVKDLGKGDSLLAAAAAIGKKHGKFKKTGRKCPKHPNLYHKWAKCDLNPNTTDVAGWDRRGAERELRENVGSSGNKRGGYAYKTQIDEIKELKAQVAALVKCSRDNNSNSEESPVEMFAALRSTLEDIAASSVNDAASFEPYTNLPRIIIDSGANMSFVQDQNMLSNTSKHVRHLLTAEGKTTHSTLAGKLQITQGSQPFYVSALVVPTFKDNLISFRQLAKSNNVLFTDKGAILQAKRDPDNNAKRIGDRGSDSLYTIPNEFMPGTSSLRATPATLHAPISDGLNSTMDHSNTKAIRDFMQRYPHAAAYILPNLGKLITKNSQKCKPCTIGKSKRKPFAENSKQPREILDAVSTYTTGPITPPDIEGNIYLQLIVDAAFGHTQGFLLKKKREAGVAILKGIAKLELAVGKIVRRYHSYNAKEQRTKKILDTLEAKGTKITTTASHTSQQNAFVERRFGTLFGATRAALNGSGLPRKYWSLACLVSIEKSNFMPIKRINGKAKAPNDSPPDISYDASKFLPFGQHGYEVYNTPRSESWMIGQSRPDTCDQRKKGNIWC